MLSIYPALSGIADLLEVVDKKNNPLLLMPQEQVLRLNLPHRRVLLIMQDKQGRIVLCRRPPCPACWGFAALRPVPAGASYEATACAALERDWALPAVPMQHKALWQPCAHNGGAFTACYVATLPSLLPLSPSAPIIESMLLDHDELRGMASTLPQLLAPEVHWALSCTGLL
jgi:hypothetical protein